ncbi:hypothetical protein [Aquabacterium sp. J223]|uniref:hypothetical protein n=1 Tax=Aquabacterium sp. J223 TaxID=2898431 RepID=UPI0021AD7B50|nr:hypothetical protein [Aquabacterium sp. J223]UUX94011.1 hypothetical protein LRS07_11655 [Aquabacterium sp. J223]
MLAMQWIAAHLPLLSLESFTAGMAGAVPDGQPIVLLTAHRVAVLNAAAAQAGIRLGHRRATALSLAPTLTWGEADPSRDALALQAVAHVALAFTPSVLWRPRQHLVLLEVQSCLRYWGACTGSPGGFGRRCGRWGMRCAGPRRPPRRLRRCWHGRRTVPGRSGPKPMPTLGSAAW